MRSCNIATGAVCNYTNTIASVPTSEISRSGVGVSQHLGPRVGRCADVSTQVWRTSWARLTMVNQGATSHLYVSKN